VRQSPSPDCCRGKSKAIPSGSRIVSPSGEAGRNCQTARGHPRPRLVLDLLDQVAQLDRLLVAVLDQVAEVSFQPEVLAEEHERVDESPDLVEGELPHDVSLEVGRRRDLGQRMDGGVFQGPRGGAALLAFHELRGFRLDLFLQPRAGRRVEEAFGEVEAVHGVAGVQRQPFVLRGDALARESAGQSRAADQHGRAGAVDAQLLGGDHHLLR
jgi:hypothetical protein